MDRYGIRDIPLNVIEAYHSHEVRLPNGIRKTDIGVTILGLTLFLIFPNIFKGTLMIIVRSDYVFFYLHL